MPWLQLELVVDVGELSRIEQLLSDAGALSLSSADADDGETLELAPGAPPLWTRVRVAALFDLNVDRAGVQRVLEPAGNTFVAWRTVDDRDWTRAWMEHARPLCFGARLWVCPTFAPPPADAEAIVVRLDPGQAFGSGSHESTALCLEWLESRVDAGTRLLDFGCGSGILSVAALRLGAVEAWACDIDAQALDATRDNAERNGVGHALHVCAPKELPAIAADLVVANIVERTLIDLAPTLARHTRPAAFAALSGILHHQADGVIRAYSPWFDFAAPRARGDWILLEGARR